MEMKRIVLHVMGCRLNAAEGARIRGALEAAGWEVRESGAPPAGPDAFVLHTCAVTATAQTEALRRRRGARRAGVPRIVVSGCAANVASESELRAAGADTASSS